MKKQIITLITVVVCAVFVVSVANMAGGTAGSESDPLVTLSYIRDVTAKEITEQTAAKITEQVGKLETELNVKIGLTAPASGGGAGTFAVLTLNAGQSVTCSVGAEIIPRTGSAACVAAKSPGLIDSTDGVVLENGGALQKNHLYVVTVAGRGFKAGSGGATVVIRGAYTVE